ncbi:MAG TPA: hypothetical protein VN958_07210 [Chitinophagaceae bacterium]|nr:hypothetical protein [Chitinophagaceae bacterium]
MAFYLKKHMIFHDYNWTQYSNDDPYVSGVPDNTLFDKNEGYQVLYMINIFGKTFQQMTINVGKKIEIMIRGLPPYVKRQTDVLDWLFNNWSRY